MPGPIMKCGCAAQGVATAIGGEKLAEPIPACVIHDCYEMAETKPDLTGRMARCVCGRLEPSDPDKLAFFEFRGDGSRHATDFCKCGYHKVAHEHDTSRVRPEPVSCKNGGFEPRGPHEYDSFYCGCRGWD